MTIKTHQLAYAMADVVATHQLLHYAKKENNGERIRLVTGATMAGLGFAFGPELEERIKSLHDQELSDMMKQQLLYSAGGAVLGGVAGYLFGPKVLQTTKQKHETIRNSIPALEKELSACSQKKPGGLLTIASAGWLGYSLFFNDKTSEEQEHRQLWGLGAGALGYLYGADAIKKMKQFVIPQNVRDDAVEVYSRGASVFTALAGGALGWYAGRNPKKQS